MTHTEYFLQVLDEIKARDSLHYKQLPPPPPCANLTDGKEEFEELCKVICRYCMDTGVNPAKLADYYLRVIYDCRVEAVIFLRTGEYSCKSQVDAEKNVYSNKEFMTYYMYGLMFSQLLWKQHFDVFLYLKKNLPRLLANKNPKILEVGAGHGLFTYMVKQWYPDYEHYEVVDISERSLEIARRIAGTDGRVTYLHKNIFDFDSDGEYDFIMLGEVLEHLDEPALMLSKLSRLLNKDGILWLTVPANSPAPDHVYLFKSRDEVLSLIQSCGLRVIESAVFCEKNMDEKTAEKRKAASIVAAFCKKS